MEKYAIIVAGGAGLRMGNATPKQFLLLYGKPVLHYTIKAFMDAYADIHIVLVVPKQHNDTSFLQSLSTQMITVVDGGETRYHSVKNGLEKVPDDSVVFVQDGVRCLVSCDLITRCYEQTVAKGSAVPVVPATDSMRIDKGNEHYVVDRQFIRIVQTPQTFTSNDLKLAFNQPYHESFTDEATVMEAFGKPVFLIDGEFENIKITRPLDLIIAESLLKSRL